MANLITGSRIALSILLLFCTPFSAAFYALYFAAGLTDMIDGTVARMTGTAGESGAKLDTLADIVFTAVCTLKLLPVLNLPAWTYCCAAVIAFTLVTGYIRRKEFTAVHSLLNKITGAMLFVFPLTLSFIELRYSAAAVCIVAACAAIQESYYIAAPE